MDFWMAVTLLLQGWVDGLEEDWTAWTWSGGTGTGRIKTRFRKRRVGDSDKRQVGWRGGGPAGEMQPKMT